MQEYVIFVGNISKKNIAEDKNHPKVRDYLDHL